MKINKSEYSIVMLICWYGPFPWYFQYFLHSCSYNSTIDFIIITDNKYEGEKIPKNIYFVYKSLNDISKLASKKLKLPINIQTPYKLCDFKPTYAFLFPELIDGYDFWGHFDLDVVYGNIRYFLNEDILSKNDVITCRHDYISGTFTLFKNKREINKLFMKSKDYKNVLCSEEHFCFDECNFLFEELQHGASIFDFPNSIESMTHVVKSEQRKGRINAFFDFMILEGNPGKIKWEKGRVYYKDEFEALLYHLIKFKTECKRPKILNPIPHKYFFTPHKIKV